MQALNYRRVVVGLKIKPCPFSAQQLTTRRNRTALNDTEQRNEESKLLQLLTVEARRSGLDGLKLEGLVASLHEKSENQSENQGSPFRGEAKGCSQER